MDDGHTDGKSPGLSSESGETTGEREDGQGLMTAIDGQRAVGIQC